MLAQSLLNFVLAFLIATSVRAATVTNPHQPLVPRQTSSPSTTTKFDANVAACSSYSSIFGSCAAATSSFPQLPFSSEASCLCYTGATSPTYAPSIYDGYWGSCLNYYQTASPDYYSMTLSGDTSTRTPCAAAGNVLGPGAATGVVSVVVTKSSSAASGAGVTSRTGNATSTGSGIKSGAANMQRDGVAVGLIALVAVCAIL